MMKKKAFKKVLIVEDEPISRNMLLAHLADHFDLCLTASNGQEAVDAYVKSLDEDEPFSLICLDIMMPVMDGQAALQEIRRIEKERAIPSQGRVKVLMTTALGGAKDITTAFMKGSCEGYLTKPLDINKLEEYLKKIGFG